MGVAWLVVLSVMTGCGRIGIDPITRGDAAPGDGNRDATSDGGGSAATLAGTYTLDTAIAYSCAIGVVDITVSKFTFAPAGAMLSVTSDDTGTPSQPCTMLGPMPSGATFGVSCTLPGTCNEIYGLAGSIVDSKHWTGTFTATFTGMCVNCTTQMFARTGTTP